MATDIKSLFETAGRAVGTLVGTAAGVAAAAASTLVGKAPAPKVDPVTEEVYWREHYAAEPYYDANFNFEDYLPAWRTGWEGRAKYAGRSFEDAERELEADFHWNRGRSRLLWQQARAAVRAAFVRTV
jgi:hypothetical protein